MNSQVFSERYLGNEEAEECSVREIDIEREIISLNHEDKEMILEIQRNFHSRAVDERFFQSITPVSSYNSIISRSNNEILTTPRDSSAGNDFLRASNRNSSNNEFLRQSTIGNNSDKSNDIFQGKLRDTSNIE